MLNHHIVDSLRTVDEEIYEVWKVSVSESQTRYSSYALYYKEGTDDQKVRGLIYKLNDTRFTAALIGEEQTIPTGSPYFKSYCSLIEDFLSKEYPGKTVESFG